MANNLPNYVFLKSKLNGNVIDIVEASTQPGALLDAWPQKTTGNDNQLWRFVLDRESGYFFIQSKLNGNVIDIVEASTQPGALLDVWPQKTTGSDNQLWKFLPVYGPGGEIPTAALGYEVGWGFIQSKLNGYVIDIQGASTQPGAPLDAWPQKTTGNDNQLWMFLDV